MITGVHADIHATDPDAARAFFRDVLFRLPPAELSVHPAEATGTHELFLTCDDIEATVADLTAKGVEFVSPVTDTSWGRLTELTVPGAGTLRLYEPKHPHPL